MTPELSSSLSLAMPELILVVGALALLMIGVFSSARAYGMVNALAIAVLIAAGGWMALQGGSGEAFGGSFLVDPFAHFMKILALIGSAAALLMSGVFAKELNFDKFEFPVLVLLCTLGMMLMISANSMIALYLGLELQSLAIYVLAAFNRDNLLPVSGYRLEGPHHHTHNQCHRGHLRRGREEGCHRRRRTLIDVGRPHVERHCGNLEAETRKHEDEAENDAKLAFAIAQRRRDLLEAGVSGVTVDEADAVEQHAGRQCAENEIFQAGFR